MRKFVSAGLIGGLAAALFAPAGAVAGTLDQQQPNLSGSALQIQATQSVSQTFTAGRTGGLDRVDLGLSKGGAAGSLTSPLTVEIRNASAGGPGTTVLATGSVPPTAVVAPSAAFISVAFSTPAPVIAGTQYAIVAYSAEPNTRHYDWSITAMGPYPAGTSWFSAASPPSTAWNDFDPSDTAFKTYVADPVFKGKAKKCKKKKAKKKSAASAKKKKKKKKCKKKKKKRK